MKQFLEQCADAVLKGNRSAAEDLARIAMEKGYELLDVIENGFSKGIREAGDLWEAGEYFLPELAFSAEAMKTAMELLQPALIKLNEGDRGRGRVVIGTIQGDIHDIGKTLVATLLAANGYTVLDLGADVPHERFLSEIEGKHPKLLCMSALLTTTMSGQGYIVEQLKKKGLRDKIKVMVGGAPTSTDWAMEIGADGYAENAVEAVKMAQTLLAGD
jgi:corrinoid protein of di/trimethylamine methyltransferase